MRSLALGATDTSWAAEGFQNRPNVSRTGYDSRPGRQRGLAAPRLRLPSEKGNFCSQHAATRHWLPGWTSQRPTPHGWPRAQGSPSLPPWRALHGHTASLQGEGLYSCWSAVKLWPSLESRVLPTRAACEIRTAKLGLATSSRKRIVALVVQQPAPGSWWHNPNAGSTGGRSFTRGLRPCCYQSPATLSGKGHSCPQGRTGEGYSELSEGGVARIDGSGATWGSSYPCRSRATECNSRSVKPCAFSADSPEA